MKPSLISALLAITVLLHAGSLPMTHALPYRARGELRARLASEALRRGEELRRKWNLDGAEAAFNEAATLEPASLEAALGLARVARARIEYAHAISLLDKAAGEHPNSVAVLNEYGSIYIAAEEPERARRQFESALRISASDTPAIVGLAAVDLLERNYERAIRSLRQCLAREPQNSTVHSLLARALLEINRESEAAEEAGRAIALDAYNVEALYILACVKASERKGNESRSLARRAVSLDPFNFGARRVLSQYVDGQAGYEQRVADQARIRYASGRSLKQEGQLTRAVTELEAALGIEPHYYRALIALADIWLRQGEYERAAYAAKVATAFDPDGAIAHFELSCAYRGMNERARIEIGAVDFGALFYGRPAPAAYALTREIFPNYGSLTRRQQSVIDAAVGPLAVFLPKLARHKARHYLLAFDQRPSDLRGFADIADEKTFDGRYYASIRGVGGRVAVSGIEYLDQAARGGFNTIAHEFAHQVHIAAMGKSEVKEIRSLYERARREGRILDTYAAANEYEYFAQGYEAFISDRKRPSAGVTARHTNRELFTSDPELYKFLVNLTAKSHAISRSRGGTKSDCLNLIAGLNLIA
jgi:tetratricopeptide (TPR) repeat protein